MNDRMNDREAAMDPNAERTRQASDDEPMSDELRGRGPRESDENIETADPAMKDQPAEGGVEEAEPQTSWRDQRR